MIAITDANYTQDKHNVNVIVSIVYNILILQYYNIKNDCNIYLNIQKICDNYLESSYSKLTINTNDNNSQEINAPNISTLGSGYRAGYWRQFVTLLWRSYVVLAYNTAVNVNLIFVIMVRITYYMYN